MSHSASAACNVYTVIDWGKTSSLRDFKKKKHFSVLLIFFYCFSLLCFIYFHPDLLFLLLTSDLVCIPFPVPWGVKLNCLSVFVFLNIVTKILITLLELLLLHYISFWFSFSFVSEYFFSLFVFFFDSLVVRSVLCNFHILVKFPVFFLLLISSFILLWSEKNLDMISVFLNLLRFVSWHNKWSVLRNVPLHMRRLQGCPMCPCWFSVWVIYLLSRVGTVLLLISPFRSANIRFIYLGALLCNDFNLVISLSSIWKTFTITFVLSHRSRMVTSSLWILLWFAAYFHA